MTNNEPKKTWTSPQLFIHGDLEKITKGPPPYVKKIGAQDGIVVVVGSDITLGSP